MPDLCSVLRLSSSGNSTQCLIHINYVTTVLYQMFLDQTRLDRSQWHRVLANSMLQI